LKKNIDRLNIRLGTGLGAKLSDYCRTNNLTMSAAVRILLSVGVGRENEIPQARREAMLREAYSTAVKTIITAVNESIHKLTILIGERPDDE